MRKIMKKVAGFIFTAIFAFMGMMSVCISAQNAERVGAHAATTYVSINWADTTCTEFAAFSEYSDTHRTRITVRKNVSEWGFVAVNLSQPSWLDLITVNGKTLATYQSEYIASGSPEIETSDTNFNYYVECRPIYVFFTDDYANSANVIDIYVPENYIPAKDMKEVGISGTMQHVYEGDNTCYYTLSGEVSFQNPNATAPTYMVTVDGVAQEVKQGELAKAPDATPTKAETKSHRYEFLGWYYSNESGEEIKWDFENDAVVSDLTLTAKFLEVEKTKYTVTFDADNGSKKVAIQVYEGACIEEDELPEDPIKAETEEGSYTFKIWLNADTGAPFDFFTPICDDLTLVASYTTTAKYTVKIDETERTVFHGEKLQEPALPTMEETESHTYEFLGWYYTDVNGENRKWNFENDTVVSDLTLEATFLAVEKTKYTVTFTANNGDENRTVQVYEGAYIKGEQIPEEPTKVGTESHTYEFLGWYYLNGEQEKIYWDFATDTVSGALVLQADFQAVEKPKHTVTFYANNGENDITVQIYDGACIKTEQIPADPIKAEEERAVYAFRFWSIDGETAWAFETSTITEDIRLQACYKVTPVYMVSVSGETQRVVADSLAIEPETKPTKEETADAVFLFDCWVNADTGASFSFDTPITADISVVAKFTSIAKYTVSIDGEKQVVLDGTKLTAPSVTPTKEATESHTYEFLGWYYINGAGEEIYWDFAKDLVKSSLTLQAGFRAIEKTKYTVTFDADNGTAPITIEVYEGAYIPTEQIPGDPQKI